MAKDDNILAGIFDDLKAYKDNARGYRVIAWELSVEAVASAWTKPLSIVQRTPRYAPAWGTILCMNVNGSGNHQLWQYWEDSLSNALLPRHDDELDNSPGIWQIEKLAHDNSKNLAHMVSPSRKYFLWTSNKDSNLDMPIYITRLVDSHTGIRPDDTVRFHIPSFLVTPAPGDYAATWRWHVQSMFLDEKYMLLIERWATSISRYISSTFLLWLLHRLAEPTFKPHKRVMFAGSSEDCIIDYVRFSKVPAQPSLIYFLTDVHGDFVPVASYDLDTEMLIHITTSKPSVQSLRPIPAHCTLLARSPETVEGRRLLYAMPLVGKHTHTVLEVRLEGFEGGGIGCLPDTKNEGRYYQLALTLQWHESRRYVVRVDVAPYLEVDADAFRGPHITTKVYSRRVSTHDYVLNIMGCATIYSNVRGGSGYVRHTSKQTMWRNEKTLLRLRDIGALLDFIRDHKSNELDATKIAVMGGSYVSMFRLQMVVTSLHDLLSHWPSFLHNAASSRRDVLCAEYGDERIPETRKFLERISPVNNAHEVAVPPGIAHGHRNLHFRWSLGEAFLMRERVRKQGVPIELIVCEKEGYGFKQKSVIEYANAARVYFPERMHSSRSVVYKSS
ncbi:hypothetical protein FISHEDRAFT_56670 [Fistulina hepatica ATCC 64428]|uniref:Peptidase S9 prolyl oligopeptidase catalytic domain-containing protein n=1 Tax=Fistulina hepatica ATCC 64428 TaxID=1128425 RepID=A0A0D7AIF6_9AGAR|nr:hypothetical protein FISHEDRAFT_56670 [Fistulina hepatica ATCC 64428]